jgi:hypothetical protein
VPTSKMFGKTEVSGMVIGQFRNQVTSASFDLGHEIQTLFSVSTNTTGDNMSCDIMGWETPNHITFARQQ